MGQERLVSVMPSVPLIPAPARFLHLPEAPSVGKNEMSRKGCFLNCQTKRGDYLQELLLSHSGRTGILWGGGNTEGCTINPLRIRLQVEEKCSVIVDK